MSLLRPSLEICHNVYTLSEVDFIVGNKVRVGRGGDGLQQRPSPSKTVRFFEEYSNFRIGDSSCLFPHLVGYAAITRTATFLKYGTFSRACCNGKTQE